MELQYNEPLYREKLEPTTFSPLAIVNVGKKPRYNKSSFKRTNFPSPLAIRYIEVPLYYISRGMLQAEINVKDVLHCWEEFHAINCKQRETTEENRS